MSLDLYQHRLPYVERKLDYSHGLAVRKMGCHVELGVPENRAII